MRLICRVYCVSRRRRNHSEERHLLRSSTTAARPFHFFPARDLGKRGNMTLATARGSAFSWALFVHANTLIAADGCCSSCRRRCHRMRINVPKLLPPPPPPPPPQSASSYSRAQKDFLFRPQVLFRRDLSFISSSTLLFITCVRFLVRTEHWQNRFLHIFSPLLHLRHASTLWRWFHLRRRSRRQSFLESLLLEWKERGFFFPNNTPPHPRSGNLQ